MASSATSSMLAHVALAKNSLAEIDERRTIVRTALDAALASAASFRDELKSLNSRHSALLADISTQRSLLMRQGMSSFPTELLRAVFLELTDGQEKQSVDDDQCDEYDPIRAATPFRLSAVCARWRQVAVEFPEIWTYVGVPELVDLEPHSAHAIYRYVKTVLQRSQSQGCQAAGQPLRIVLDWRSEDVSWDDSRYHQKILDLIGRYAYRWGRIDAAFPKGLDPSHALAFRRSTPMLQRVWITLLGDEVNFPWSESLPPYLPECPQIRFLVADFFFFRPTAPLPYITTLHLAIDGVALGVVWDVLRLTPHLRALHLTIDDLLDDTSTTPTPPIALAMLTTIAVYSEAEPFSRVVAGIHIPNVATLHCGSSFDLQTEGVPDNLTEVLIDYATEDCPMTSEAPSNIRSIDSLRRLSIAQCEHIHGSFFRAARSPDVCWKNLCSVRLESTTLDDDAASDFADFLRTRTAHGSSPPLEVHVKDCDMPKWFDAEIWHILGDRFVHDTDLDDSKASESSASSDEDVDA
ncbi:hypothetical protein EXIGLDRAFT_733171 [Exidia glandulosa HHB12029]|uniref:F-box domain-containing protein n=1 Tax=Exidia glandulosa HHB12029 TaxID=1314781 RepID=A0A165KKT9_EXIGL|nr:hypothetical protein EXIGLDRAFT_733171 [Exidia glandulosa HHB12029]